MNLLKNKLFKSIFSIGIFTNIGDSIFFIVTMWYISNNANHSFYTGVVVFLFTLPDTLLLFLGPFIDKFNPKNILSIATTSQILIHIILVLLFVFDSVTIGILLVLLFFSAISSSVIYPVEETMIPQVVENRDIVQANSWFSIAYKLTNSLFDGLAGLLLAISAVSWLYGMNLFIFIIPLLLIKRLNVIVKTKPQETFQSKTYVKDLKEGLSFVMKSTIRLMVLPLAFLNFFTAINIVALPFFANSLSPNPSTYGLLLSFSGIGSMLGALVINRLEARLSVGKLLTVGLFLNGVMWLGTIFSPLPAIAYLFIFLANFCMGGYNIIFSSLFQVMTPPELLGRVNTCVDSIITIAMPIGSLVGGGLLAILPLQTVMVLNASALIVTAIIYFSNKSIYGLENIAQVKPVEIR